MLLLRVRERNRYTSVKYLQITSNEYNDPYTSDVHRGPESMTAGIQSDDITLNLMLSLCFPSTSRE